MELFLIPSEGRPCSAYSCPGKKKTCLPGIDVSLVLVVKTVSSLGTRLGTDLLL